jgi:hypothetical protein
MRSIALLFAAFFGSAVAFVPLSKPLLRNSGVSMSHFSTIKTQLKSKELLLTSLEDIGAKVKVADQFLLPVRGYNGQTVDAEVAIEQDNGQDIGFRFNGKTYEMVADLMFWGQSVPADRFLEKLTQRYSVNAVLESAAQGGYAVQYVENKIDNTVEIELSRYVV